MAAVAVPVQRKLGSVSLQRLIELTPLAPAEAVYIALSLLQALAVARDGESDVVPGPSDVRITEAGEVMLEERAIPGPAFRREAVMGVGQMLLPAQAARDPLVDVALDSLAMGAFGRTPEGAAAALRHQLAGLATPEAMEEAQANLEVFVRQLPAARLESPAPPAAGSAGDSRARVPAALIAVGVVLLAVLGVLVAITGSAGSAGPKAAAPAHPAAAPSAASAAKEAAVPPKAPVLAPLQTFVPPAPAAAGRMQGVSVTVAGPCQAGGTCATTVDLRFAPARVPTALAWELVLYDACDGSSRSVANGSYPAPAGWNRVLWDGRVSLVGAHRGELVALTTSPDAVASAPVEVAGPDCAGA